MITALTALIALFTFLAWRTYKRIEFLTGSMDSHSTLDIRLQILKWNTEHPDQKIEMVWWDKTKESPPIAVAHRQPVSTERIYLMLPPEMREGKESLCRDFRTALQATYRYITGKCRWPKE